MMVTWMSIATEVMVMVMEGDLMCAGFMKEHGSAVHIAGVCLERHGFHLCWLGDLKGVNFRLLSLFFHWMVLK